MLWWLVHKHIFARAGNLPYLQSARPHKGKVCKVMHKEFEEGASPEHLFASRMSKNIPCHCQTPHSAVSTQVHDKYNLCCQASSPFLLGFSEHLYI